MSLHIQYTYMQYTYILFPTNMCTHVTKKIKISQVFWKLEHTAAIVASTHTPTQSYTFADTHVPTYLHTHTYTYTHTHTHTRTFIYDD